MNAIITGAAGGIGMGIVEKFAKEGVNLWACARVKNDAFELRLKELEAKYQVWIRPVYFDMQQEEEIKQGLKVIFGDKENIDILVNNAGKAYGNLALMTSMEELHEAFQVNFFAQVMISQLVAKKMIKNKSGAIVNIVSAGGLENQSGYLAYGGSKNALTWATKTLAVEFADYGIRVNAVAPGLTDTKMGHFKSEEELKNTLARTPMNRMANVPEVADAVYYLASKEASFITGQILSVDGGRSCM